MHYRTRSFILGKEDRGEADLVFSVFAEDFGRLTVLGRGIRKVNSKLGGNIPILSICEIEFVRGRYYKTLTDTVLIDGLGGIKRNLEKLKIAYQIAEVFDILIKISEKDKKIWRLLLGVFQYLESFSGRGHKLRLIYHYFVWNLFCLLGYQPELYRCLLCNKRLKPENLYFSSGGGIVCSSCSQRTKLEQTKMLRVGVDSIKILRKIIERDIDFLTALKIKPDHEQSLEKISNFYLSSFA